MFYEIAFKEGLPYDCTCPVCEQALRAPVITKCGHIFCKQCINVENGPIPCPVCQAEIAPDALKPDKKKQIQVQSLLVKCPYVRYGCEWTGPLKEMQSHADSCQFCGVPCTNCDKKIAQSQLAEHLVECEKTCGKCTYCGVKVKTSNMEKHLKICPKMIVSCPFQCGLIDRTREEIEAHRASCPNVDNVCPFAELGCKFIGDKASVQQHLSEEPVRHLMYLCDEATDLKNFYISGQAELNAVITRYDELIRKSITANEMYGAQLVWRIENVTQKKNEARSGTRPIIHSEPFVSGRHGYKMFASACLFGDGPQRGKYLAVYLTLMKGKYDSILPWPFDLTACITLLDQNPNIKERCDISYRVDTRKIKEKSDFLDRPLSGRNASFGAQAFCRLEVMENFIVDDVMFLKVEIEVIRPSERMMIKRPSPSEMSTAVVSDTELQSSAVAASRAQTPLSKALAPSNPQSPRAHTPNGPKEPVPSPMEPAPVPVVINVENGTPDSPAKEKQRPKA